MPEISPDIRDKKMTQKWVPLKDALHHQQFTTYLTPKHINPWDTLGIVEQAPNLGNKVQVSRKPCFSVKKRFGVIRRKKGRTQVDRSYLALCSVK